MKKPNFISLPTFSDERGALTILEKEVDFLIKRIYWTYGADGHKRGGHRHKITKQALVAINGEIHIHIKKKGFEYDFILNKPSECLILEPEDWHTLDFYKGGILLVAASHYFDKNDYIYEAL